MGTDLRWARARAVAEGREGVFVAVVVPRVASLSLSLKGRDFEIGVPLSPAAGNPVKW